MSISHLSSAHPTSATHGRTNEHRQNLEKQFAPGEFVSLKVSRRLDERHYLVSLANSEHVVESSVRLEVGSKVRAAVVSVGEKLELKYVSTEEPVDLGQRLEEHETTADEIGTLERKYAIALDRMQRESIRELMNTAGNPAVMAVSGMYLGKLALPVESATLKALYASQVWSQSEVTASDAQAFASSEDLAQALGDALDSSESPVPTESEVDASDAGAFSANTDSNDSGTRRDLAHRVLNTQDEGSVGYSYGLLPVMIGDELVELDLVYFRNHREVEPGQGIRRLVMSFSTAKLGHVEITAQAFGERLSIAIKTDSAVANHALAARVDEARELAGGLGWNVESVRYDLQVDTSRAARHIVEHVLNADTLSRLV